MSLSLKTTFKKILVKLGYEPEKPDLTPLDEGHRRNFNRRRQQLLEGFVRFDGTGTSHPCSVRDMNHFGGRVELWDDVSPSRMRQTLTLYIPCDRHEVECDVAWVTGRSMGLRFRSNFRSPTRIYA